MQEEDIRPRKIFDEYLKLCKEDIEHLFYGCKTIELDCPVCETKPEFWFEKDRFSYVRCSSCLTFFVSPRPKEKYFHDFYRSGKSVQFFASHFYSQTENARREKIWKPKIQMIRDILQKYQSEKAMVIDIGGGFGTFAELYEQITHLSTLVVEPSADLARICHQKKITVIQKFLEDLSMQDIPSGLKCFVSFEILEHIFDPVNFLKKLYSLMKNNDFFIFTTLNGLGVDIAELGRLSQAVTPPQHINFFNTKSIEILLKKIGFKVITVKTPGKLDLDILKNNLSHCKEGFLKSFLTSSLKEEIENFQQIIQNCGLSSHMMITCQK